jgi:hypothetical protein
VHLVGVIIGIHYDARTNERQKENTKNETQTEQDCQTQQTRFNDEFLYFRNSHKIPRCAGKCNFNYAQKKTTILALARKFL